jgi:hypothetical protein
MPVYRRTPGGPYHVEVEWRGYPRLHLSTGTRRKARPDAMERTLKDLHDAGRRDILGLLAAHRLELADVDEEYLKRPADLEHRIAHVESPAVGVLVDEWLSRVSQGFCRWRASSTCSASKTVTR